MQFFVRPTVRRTPPPPSSTWSASVGSTARWTRKIGRYSPHSTAEPASAVFSADTGQPRVHTEREPAAETGRIRRDDESTATVTLRATLPLTSCFHRISMYRNAIMSVCFLVCP
ncbi:hypothetical protein WN55_02418 [Dufourea novaeangliae]|uniref:Uncharacterized protein n=1 Tax=Dufourea novaeangliae TaxID=178035 RepID=A0A154PGU3_DUFNO|nr:hypothetical protein WN55_02418 [Dufourea novaeangliae]